MPNTFAELLGTQPCFDHYSILHLFHVTLKCDREFPVICFVYMNIPSQPLWAILGYGPRQAFGWSFKVTFQKVHHQWRGSNLRPSDPKFYRVFRLCELFVRTNECIAKRQGKSKPCSFCFLQKFIIANLHTRLHNTRVYKITTR